MAAARGSQMAGAELHCSSRLGFSLSVSEVAAPSVTGRAEEDEGAASDQDASSI